MKTATTQTQRISRAAFNSLMRGAEIMSGTDLDNVSFKCQLRNTFIIFGGRIENNYKLEVEDFGRMRGSNWVQAEPTPVQLETMQNMILSTVAEIHEEKKLDEVLNARLDHEAKAEEIYGHPGAIYNNWY